MLKRFKTEPEFIEVKDVNRTAIHIIFGMDYKREDIVTNILMRRMLSNYNNEFKTIKQFRNKKDELFIMNYNVNTITLDNKVLIDFFLSIPKEGIIEEFKIDNAIKFLHDNIFNPSIDSDKFEDNAFNFELDFLINRENNFPTSIGAYASDIFLKFFDENNLTELNHDEYLNYLKSVNSKDTYNYYKKNIKNNNYKIYVFGSSDNKDSLIKSINKYFKQKEEVFEIELNKYNFISILEYKEKNIETKYNQTVLNLFYQFKDLKEEEISIFNMLHYFLNSRENDLIYDNLRNKNHLIYDSYISSSQKYGVIGIRVFLDNKDIDKSIDIINKTFDDMKKEENFNIYKKRLLIALQYDIYYSLDNPFNSVNDIINKEYNIDYTLQEKREQINKITFEEFKDFLNKIILTRKMIMIAGVNNGD